MKTLNVLILFFLLNVINIEEALSSFRCALQWQKESHASLLVMGEIERLVVLLPNISPQHKRIQQLSILGTQKLTKLKDAYPELIKIIVKFFVRWLKKTDAIT